MKQVDVVIISWAKDDSLKAVTKAGLDSLFNSDKGDIAFNAIVIESNPEVNYDEYNQFLWMHSCKTIHPTVPFGYHRYLNLGVRESNSPYVVLCNSDLTYEKGWASSIIDLMEAHPDFLSASPWCPETQGSNENHKGLIYEGNRVRGELAGWCIFQQRKIYDILGELDEDFEFWYCDNSYSEELKRHGIKHGLVPDSIVHHHGEVLGKTGMTLSHEEQVKITVDQEKIFTKKYVNQ